MASNIEGDNSLAEPEGRQRRCDQDSSRTLHDMKDSVSHRETSFNPEQKGTQYGNDEEIREKLMKDYPKLIAGFDAVPLIPVFKGAIPEDALDEITEPTIKKTRNCLLIKYIHKNMPRAYATFVKCLAGLNPEIFKLLEEREPRNDEKDFFVGRFHQELKEKILKEGHKPDNHTDARIDLGCEYVQLSVIKSSEQKQRREENMHDGELPNRFAGFCDHVSDAVTPLDILQKECEGRKFNRKLLVGRAGIGKTTTVQWIMRQWASGEFESEWSVAFMIPLRQLMTSQTKLSLHELLLKYNLYKAPRSETAFLPESWLRNNESRVLINLDGLDEVKNIARHMEDTPEVHDVDEKADALDIVVNLLRGTLLPKSMVICTSRQFLGLSSLPQEKYWSYEIMGLTRERIQTFVHRRYPESYERIHAALIKNPLLLSVCSITYYCSVITSLLNEDLSLSEKDITTYTRLQSYIVKRYASRKLRGESKFGLNAKGCLPKLSELAYNGIFGRDSKESSQIVFTNEDVENISLTEEDLKKEVARGLLVCSESGDLLTVEFFHLCVQELLSVAYMLNQVSSESEKFKSALQKLSVSGKLNMVLLYLFGFCFDAGNEWIRSVFSASCSGKFCEPSSDIKSMVTLFLDDLLKNSPNLHDWDQPSRFLLCQLAYESQSAEIAKAVAKVIMCSDVSVYNTLVTALDIKSLVFTCQHSNAQVIRFDKAHIDDVSTQILSQFLVNNNHVKILNLNSNLIRKDGLTALGEMLSTNQSLEELSLNDNLIEDGDMEEFLQGLSKNRVLTSLSLHSNLLGDQTAEGLREWFDPKRKTLSLCDNLISYKGLNLLTEGHDKHLYSSSFLTGNPVDVHTCTPGGRNRPREQWRIHERAKSARIINLNGLNISDSVVKHLCSVLDGSTTIRELNLGNNSFSQECIPWIRSLAFTCPNLKRVNLSGVGFTEEIERSFSNMTVRNDAEELNVSIWNRIGEYCSNPEGIHLSMDSLHFLKSGPSSWPSLSALSINFCHIGLTTQQLTTICTICQRSSMLKSFELQDIPSSAGKFKMWNCLISEVEKLEHLSVIKMVGYSPQVELLERFFSLLEMKKSKITKLVCSPRPVTRQNLPRPSEDCRGVDPRYLQCFQRFFADLAVNNTLVNLDLSFTKMVVSSAHFLAEALKVNSTLTTLRLNNCSLDCRAIARLASGIAINKGLKSLDLSENPSGDMGAKHLSECLKLNDSLASLNLSFTEIDDGGVEYLSEGLKINKTLRDLDISGADDAYLDFGALALVEALKQNKTLIDLKMPQILVIDWEKDIRAALRQNKERMVRCKQEL